VPIFSFIKMENLSRIKDEDLFALVQQNNAKALETLIERYSVVICEFVHRIVKSPETAEELASDTFVKLWLNRHQINLQLSLKAYLYTIAKNLALDFLQKKRIQTSPEENAYFTISDVNDEADKMLHYQEFEGHIERLLQEMPPQRQLIFRMNRLEGLKYKEIAEVLSISVHTVQNQMVEATKFMAQKYPLMESLKIVLLLFSFFTA
jgi:RNA polymerase sigma-70 factor, ECF subfamily